MSKTIEIKEDITLRQDNEKVILEAGDKIKIMDEGEVLQYYLQKALTLFNMISSGQADIPEDEIELKNILRKLKQLDEPITIELERAMNLA